MEYEPYECTHPLGSAFLGGLSGIMLYVACGLGADVTPWDVFVTGITAFSLMGAILFAGIAAMVQLRKHLIHEHVRIDTEPDEEWWEEELPQSQDRTP